MQRRLAEEILAFARALPEGQLLHAKSLLHLATRVAVDQSLSRLAQRGVLTRVGRGAYALPIETEFGPRPPNARKVVETLAKTSGEVIAGSPAEAANSLGLTTQVPAGRTYLTTGPSRRLVLALPGREPKSGSWNASTVVELRHAPRWQLALATKPAGRVVRALAWATTEIEIEREITRGPRKRMSRSESRLLATRRRHAVEKILQEVAPRISAEERKELLLARPSMPTWIAEPLSQVLAHA